MPQLDFFTLLFQFKSFAIFFFLLYFFFVFVFVPKLHLVISVRRSQVLNLLAYYFYLKTVVFSSFSFQSLILKNHLFFFNEISNLFFLKYLDSKFSVSSFLFSHQNF